MNTIQSGKNTGVIIKEPTRFGAVVELPTITNTASDWRSYECDGEWQKDMTIEWDSDACMTFTVVNSISTYLNWLISTNQILDPQLAFLKNNGYIRSDGKVELSPRFNAVQNGTTEAGGNDFENVWDELPVHGVVPDSVFPMPVAEMNADPSNATAIYYQQPPQSALDLGKEFLTYFTIPSRWLVSNGQGASMEQFVEWLQIAPVHIAIAVCNPWNTAAPIQGCGTGAQHGVLVTRCVPNVVTNILDHYVPFDKQLAANYTLAYAYQGWVTQIVQPTPVVETPVQTVEQALPQVQEAIAQLPTLAPAERTAHVNIIQKLLADLLALL